MDAPMMDRYEELRRMMHAEVVEGVLAAYEESEQGLMDDADDFFERLLAE